jgi:4-amino-4-deoxy-L-arabinose transferase-like glycosyltransferase
MAARMTAHPGALPPRGTAIALALCGALLLLRLGQVPLLGPDEPRYSRVAVEMSRSGDLVTPTLQGVPWLEKPVLYYWLAAAAFRVLGETETAARLPAVLATLLLVGATALVGARLFGAGAGLHTALIAGTTLLTFAYGRAASMDMLLAATVTAAIGLFGLRFLGIAGRLAVPGAWLFMGLATLAKGPLGALLPVLVVVAWAAIRRDTAPLRALLSPWGWLAFALLAGPWYVLVLQAQGWAFVDTFFLNHNLQRFTSTVHRHPGPIVYYLPVLLLGLFPWTGLLVPALRDVRPRSDPRDLFVLVWLAAPLVFFSLAGSKLPGYILPCIPPLALLLGCAADRLVQGDVGPGMAGRAAGLITLGLTAAVATLPVVALRLGEPAALSLVPVAIWSLVMGFFVSRRLFGDPGGAMRVLRVGAAGFLVLLTGAAPAILARRESGRSLFIPAAGRHVLAFGAWRTAWMAGYFYNDGRVREAGLPEILSTLDREGMVLVLCGPGERRLLQETPGLTVRVLAQGVRRNALLRVER